VTAVTLRIVEIRCDQQDCFAAHEGDPGQSTSEVRRDAMHFGWISYRRAGSDFCPDHADQEGAES
jgi:hypothetical protein